MGKRKINNDVCDMEIDWDASWEASAKPAPKKRKAYIPKTLKKKIWETYIGKHVGSALCNVCNHNEITQMDFHCGHIIPEALGGETCESNLMPICAKCNLSMGKKNLNAFKNKYFH
jgi:5-methylcytosine-specific restriction endonuclease McrA